jgi:cell wall-associated NlpC family hydrolase
VVAPATCLILAVGSAAALADGPDGTFPSAGQVRAAKQRATQAATDVAGVQAQLDAANAELDAASLAAEQAAESYNAARWKLDQATETLQRARAAEHRARHRIAGQRDRLAGMVAGSYEQGGGLSAVEAVAGTTDPAAMMGQLLTFDGASAAMDATLQRYSAGATLAEVFQKRAEEARTERVALLADATALKDAASAAAAQAQATAAAVADRRTALVARLATLQGVSVHLAAQRQAALEEQRRREAAAAAARAAAAAARKAAAEKAAADEAAAEKAAQEKAAQEAAAAADQPAAPSPAPAPAPPPPAPAPPAAPAPSGGAGAAIAFAKAQLGEPYVWGAAGPDAWDCSGLVMGAWGAAGVSLPHYSAAQYDATTPISVGDLRPGDLLFWGTTSSPSSIHHVALYLGNGMMIHAPRTGRPVSIDSMYYWIPPNFFGRV